MVIYYVLNACKWSHFSVIDHLTTFTKWLWESSKLSSASASAYLSIGVRTSCIGSSRLIRNGHSRSPLVLCIWHLRRIRSLSQSVIAAAAVACWWSLVPPAFSSHPPSTARTTGRRSSSSTAPSGWIGWRRWWAEWWAASADTDIRGWPLMQQHNINIAVNVLWGFNGVRRLRPALLTCEVVTYLVHRSNSGSIALPDGRHQ